MRLTMRPTASRLRVSVKAAAASASTGMTTSTMLAMLTLLQTRGCRRGVRRHRRGREEGRRGQSPRLREVQGEGQPGAPGPQPELGRDDRDRGVAQAWLQSGETGEGRPRRLTLAGKGMTRRAG